MSMGFYGGEGVEGRGWGEDGASGSEVF